MAYQNVGTPRFYIDYLSYCNSMGLIKKVWMKPTYNNILEGNFIGLDPSSLCVVGTDDDSAIGTMAIAIQFHEQIPVDFLETLNYVGVIGHNFHETSDEGFTLNLRAYTQWKQPTWNFPVGGANIWTGDFTPNNLSTPADGNIINTGIHELPNLDDWVTFPNNGFSIFEVKYDHIGTEEEPDLAPHSIAIGLNCYNPDPNINNQDGFIGLWNMNSLTLGTYYDMPHSPELNLTMTMEYDGVESITTRGGSHLSNVNYSGCSMWQRVDGTEAPPWTIGESDTKLRRHGRRVWDLDFNYLSDKDLFSSNYMSTHYAETGSTSNYNSEDIDTVDEVANQFYYTITDDDSFSARVLNFIGAGQRFIFQPDNTNNNPDQFAICQLDQDSLDIKQVANGVYNISLKIREVW